MAQDIFQDQANVCLLLKTRRAARAITRRYNALLASHGIQSTQAAVLFAVARGGFDSISNLAEMMAIERSALTRNIALLRERGLISSKGAKQGRAQRVELTEEAVALIYEISPLWVQAQSEVLEELGEETWNKVQSALSIVGEL